MVEDVKWRKPSNPAGVPVWEHAASSIREGDKINKEALEALIREALALNVSKKPKRA
ncbi:MAG: hypothetical protein K2Y71_17555 [Xanthobacteraceae bacterium]|nr:hypothetical protein [Xanthobacteraceae bacterium]